MKFAEDIRGAIRIGLASARANLVPMVVLWASAGALVAGYYFVPGVERGLEPVASWQRRQGWLGAFLTCSFFCGVIPYLIYRFGRRTRVESPFRVAVAQTLWCGFHGVICNWFFSVQSAWFGEGHDAVTVTLKILADQFGWTVLVIAPSNAVFYSLLVGGLRTRDLGIEAKDLFFRVYLPGLMTNWGFGIPSCLAVYSFPPALQIHVLGLISACGVIICVAIGRQLKVSRACLTHDSLASSTRISV